MAFQYSVVAPIQELERAYKFFNENLFGNFLNEEVVITIQTRGRRSNTLAWYGRDMWCAKDEKSTDKGKVIAEINLSAETFCQHDPYESLLHEMLHHYCALKGIRECSRNGRYHNKAFKVLAETVGLVCEKSGHLGWGVTKLGERGKQTKTELGPKSEIFAYLRKTAVSEKPKKKKLRKWKCECTCFWAEASYEMEVACVKCGERFSCS